MDEMITERLPLGEVYEGIANEIAQDAGCKASELEFIRKGFVPECKDQNEDERSSTEIISSGAIDRDNEILVPKGAVLEHYKKNPAVLWAHSYNQPPIGKASWVKHDRATKSIIAKTVYAVTEFAEEIWGLVKGGFLPARSVGFIPLESHEPDDKEIRRHPERSGARRVIDKWELLEYSVVPVPSNREALQQAVGKGLSLSDSLVEELGISSEMNGSLCDTTEANTDCPEKSDELSPEPPARSVERARIIVPTGRRVADTGRIVRLVKLPEKRLDNAEAIKYMVRQSIERIKGRI